MRCPMHVELSRFRALLLPLLVGVGASVPKPVPSEAREAERGVPVASSAVPATLPPPTKITFQVGERLTFNAKVSALNAGKATISVEGIEMVRGIPTFHTIFDIRGRVLFKRFANHYESWFDTTNLVSLR